MRSHSRTWSSWAGPLLLILVMPSLVAGVLVPARIPTRLPLVFQNLVPLDTFVGTIYRLADLWQGIVPDLGHRPIQFLEIGSFYGAGVISVANSFGRHPGSVLHCVDPWADYDDYSEYKGEQDTIFSQFLSNIQLAGVHDKVRVHRGFSHEVVPRFPDQMFDLIYIDGCHEPEYVLEDAVASFRKLRVGGYMIFDDYGWGGPDLTQRGIDAFLSGYHKRIQTIATTQGQVFIRKVR